MKSGFITFLAYVLILFALGLALWFLILGGFFDGNFSQPDPAKAKDIQPFVTGLVLPLLTLGSTLLVIANLQSNTLQNFSSNFFKLIDQHCKLVNDISSAVEGITTPETPCKGREFFDDLANRIAIDFDTLSRPVQQPQAPLKVKSTSCIDELIEFLKTNNLGASSSKETIFEIDSRLRENARGKTDRELLLLIYDHYYHIHQSDLGHYFRNLYHIVKFVERAGINQQSRLVYMKMLSAQLSNYELLLLAYNGLHPYGAKFYPLIEKYRLLENLNSEESVPEGYEKRIVNTDILKAAYPHLMSEWNNRQ